jgi:hypothetical protein
MFGSTVVCRSVSSSRFLRQMIERLGAFGAFLLRIEHAIDDRISLINIEIIVDIVGEYVGQIVRQQRHGPPSGNAKSRHRLVT